MDTVLSGNISQGRDMAYLGEIGKITKRKPDRREGGRQSNREKRTRATGKYCCQHINYILSGLVEDSLYGAPLTAHALMDKQCTPHFSRFKYLATHLLH